MNATLYNGYSGIKTHQFGLDSVSNNIANVNTNGYRANTVQFSSVFANSLDSLNSGSSVSSDFEYGATVASNAISTTNGSYETADDSPLNLAISGDGWFVVGENQNGSFTLNEDPVEINQKNYFTRDGDFSLDTNAYIVNSSGQYLYGIDLGKIADDGTFTLSEDSDAELAALSGATLEPLQIPTSVNAQPTLTTEADIAINLNKTDNLDGVADVYYTINSNDPDATTTFDEEAFRESDMNTLFNSDLSHLDLTQNSTMSVTVTRGESTETYSFIYGEGTDTEDVFYFTSVGDFVDKVSESTGMQVEINPDDTCVFEFSNVTEEGAEAEDLSVSFGTTSDALSTLGYTTSNQLIDLLGVTSAETVLEADNAGSVIISESLYVPTYTTNVEVYDGDGTQYLMQSTYHLTQWGGDEDVWEVDTLIYTQDMEQIVSSDFSSGVLRFDSEGNPTYTDSDSGDNISYVDFGDETIAFNPAGTGESASTNQVYKDSGMASSDVDGNPPGELEEIIIDDNGIIYLQFSNNIVEPMGRVGIANFVNDQGLSKVGSNLFELSYQIVDGEQVIASGIPELAWNENTGNLLNASILEGMLETSNVDFATALTELIILQRGYSASAKSFTTGDELIQEAINLKT